MCGVMHTFQNVLVFSPKRLDVLTQTPSRFFKTPWGLPVAGNGKGGRTPATLLKLSYRRLSSGDRSVCNSYANIASAKASKAGMSPCFMAERIVTIGSTISTSFMVSSMLFITRPAHGAHEPFTMMPARRFWYAFNFKWWRKSCIGGNTSPSYEAAATTSLLMRNASSTASAMSSRHRSACETFGAPFSRRISGNFSATFLVLPWMEA